MQYGDEKREKLNKLTNKLYSRNTPNIIDTGRSDFKQTEDSGPIENLGEEGEKSWQSTKTSRFDELVANVSNMARNKHTFVKKIFIFSLLFFVLASGIAAFVFLGGVNIVSSRNVDIKIVGPVSVGGGQEVSLDINVINNNNIDLDSASMLIEYPQGTRSVADLSKEISNERYNLGKIASGENFNQNIKVVFFGEKESVKEIKISLEYRVENSSALFYKEKTHEISISSAPVIITPTYPKEVNSNQDITFNMELSSNSKDKINNFLVKVEYPFGFVFKSASPDAFYENNVWKFSSLEPGEKKNISIKGNIIGQNNEEKVFKINIGTANENDERIISVPFSELAESILIKKSFIGLEISVGGSSKDFVSQGGPVDTEVIVRNNLPSRLFNVTAEASFKGGAFNQSSVSAGSGGFFQSINNTIFWDRRSVFEFSDMEPGSQAKLSFRLTPLLYANIPKGVKPEIEITIIAKGERILESGSVEPVSIMETRKIILATDITLSSKTVRSLGNIENSGMVPPKINLPTTYTIVWGITNSLNQVSNVEVRATLPPYVKWTNQKSPQSEILSFNPVTNEVVWNVGSLLPNTGFGSSQKQVYFQLEFLPSSSQIGQAPILLGETYLSGADKITGLKINAKAGVVTTNFSGDPSFKAGDDKVTE